MKQSGIRAEIADQRNALGRYSQCLGGTRFRLDGIRMESGATGSYEAISYEAIWNDTGNCPENRTDVTVQKWVETYPSEFVDDHVASTENPLKPATGRPFRRRFRAVDSGVFQVLENAVAVQVIKRLQLGCVAGVKLHWRMGVAV
ncbi:MAG TPA: hypothetical protein VEI01_22360 [Terriglobales bacterium]|nr:hypothetical protein [Terriglobales bacterium]